VAERVSSTGGFEPADELADVLPHVRLFGGSKRCDIERVMLGELVNFTFSEDKNYRYVLRDCWDSTKPPLLVVGLIPSTAGWKSVDRAVQRCREIAELNGYGELIVVNMFAIGPTPSHRRAAIALQCLDAIEPANDRHIGKQAPAAASSIVSPCSLLR
jgi:hypothetical protein